MSAIALGTYAAQMDQLQLLSEILWRNSASLTSERYDFASSDAATLKFYLDLHLSAFDRMNAEHDMRNLIASAARKLDGDATERDRMQLDYLEPLDELREAREEMNTTEKNEGERALRRGKAWMLLGYVQLSLFGNVDPIDPVHKVELKLKYLEEDIADYRRAIYVSMLQNRVQGTSSDVHPRIVAMRSDEGRLLKTRDDLGCLKAFRPPDDDNNFISLSRKCADFRNDKGSRRVTKRHMDNLCAIARKILGQDCTTDDIRTAEIDEAESWSLTVQSFAEQIEAETYLSAFPDVVLPLLAALAQLNHGVRILINETRRLVSLRRSGVADLDSLVCNLIRFPTIGGQADQSLLSLSDLCVSEDTKSLIGSCCTDAFVRMQEQFRILKSGLHELHNHVILNRNLTRSLWRNVNELLQQMVLVWKQQQQEEEKRAAERDSLYRNKTESHGDALTEEEELALEIRKLFPTQTDFHDIEDGSEVSLDRAEPTRKSRETDLSISGLITKDDIREIQRIHSDIVTSFTASRWMCGDPESMTSTTNYLGPLIQRYNTVHAMLDDVLPSLSGKVAIELYNSLSLLVATGLQMNREGSDGRARAYNFYKDRDVEQVKQCLPLCENILNRTDQLLEEWPNHPTLRSIRCIIERLYAFPITSPVSRFLTGLELLHVKLHEWEKNAHKGVSMLEHVTALTQQIITWRQLELSSWKGCLDATYEDLQSDTSKWWFFLYALVESYITRSTANDNNEPVTRQKLVETLERFMNESSLVEFESRLNLLLTFHCHVYHFDDSDNRNELSAVLWNVYSYYKQFADDVNARIAALKAPIEKKLRDFVKIARWNDFSYWSLKETVERTHRSLCKFVKEFQNALRQSVSSCLTVKSGSHSAETSKDDENRRKGAITPEHFTTTKLPRFADVKTSFTSGPIANAETLLTKAKRLCEKIVGSFHPSICSELEDFIESFMEESARLRGMQIDRNLPKEKQKSQAKSILQQKKMTLANYFKTLTRMGVSYRTGTLTLKNSADRVIDFTVPPLDLSVIERYFELTRIDEHMLTQWRGCERYYYKSLIRLNALNAMLSTSQTDLGPQNIERCRGYSAHMMLMAHRQKATIVRSFDHFSSLRVRISNLSEACEQDLSVSKQREGWKCATSLRALLIALEAGYEQLLLLLQCCPAESSTDPGKAALTLNANALPIIVASQKDEVWRCANSLLKDNLNYTQSIAKSLHALLVPFQVLSADLHSEDSIRASCFLNSSHFKLLAKARSTIEILRGRTRELERLFKDAEIAHPICEHIAFLDAKMERFVRDYEKLQEPEEIGERSKVNDNEIERYKLALEQLIKTILLAVQKKYKNDTDSNDEKSSEENDGERGEIEENQMSEKLVEFLEKAIAELKLAEISESFSNLLLSLRQLDQQSANYCIR